MTLHLWPQLEGHHSNIQKGDSGSISMFPSCPVGKDFELQEKNAEFRQHFASLISVFLSSETSYSL